MLNVQGAIQIVLEICLILLLYVNKIYFVFHY